MKTFITNDFLLRTDAARELYHNYAEGLPIIDYHCHLIPQQIAENKKFDNITQVWLYGDHYKWRAMRANGINERFITGDATDKEKFQAWAQTVPNAVRNPLYHWTHLELLRYFGIDDLLNPDSADDIYARTAELLQESQKKSDELAVREQELHKAMAEMTNARDESQRREAEMSGILSAVDETLLKAELDPEGKIESANQKYLSALGYRKDELLGRNIRSILSDEYLDNFDIVWQNICAGQSYQKIVNQKSKNGDNLWLLSQYTPIFDQNSNVVRVLYIANDITEQKNIEEKNKQLLAVEQERAEMLQATQESMAKNRIEMISVLTAIDETMMRAEYSVEGNLLFANAKHIKTMGYDYEQTKGKNILTFIPDEEIVEFKALWQNVCEGNMHQMTVKRKSKLTGNDIWLINQYTPVRDTDGKVFKVLYTAFDITVHKEIEEQAMKQVEIMKEQNHDLHERLRSSLKNETEFKTKLGELEKINSLAESGKSLSSLDERYRNWLKSWDK